MAGFCETYFQREGIMAKLTLIVVEFCGDWGWRQFDSRLQKTTIARW